MAILAIEGFDHFIAADLNVKAGWTQTGGVSVTTGRFGGQAISTGSANAAATITKTLPSASTTMICGFAWNALVSTTQQFFMFRTAAAAVVCGLRANTTTTVLEVTNSAGTTIASGTTPITNATWHYLEIKAFANGASGTVEIHLDGVTEIASTTVNIGSTAIGQIFFQNGTNVHTIVDDIYVLDTSGSAPRNTFLGDVRVQTIYPNGDGAHSQWTPTGGGSHYTQVNETSADGDTTYVGDGTPGDIDTYTYGDIDGGATVYGVQVNLYARKDDAATRQIAPVIRQASSDSVGTTITLGASYQIYQQLYNQDPTPADWTAANVNGDEFGVKEIA